MLALLEVTSFAYTVSFVLSFFLSLKNELTIFIVSYILVSRVATFMQI
jgi:hypothetical protein